MPVYIYGLRCPLSGAIRYVGKTVNVARRLNAHLNAAKNSKETHHRYTWLRRVIAAGMRPTIEVLREVSEGEDWQTAEREMIAEYSKVTLALTNSTEGGEGLVNIPISSRLRAADKHRNRLKDPEVNRKFRAVLAAAWADPERRAARMATLRSAEHRAKLAVAQKKAWDDPATRKSRTDGITKSARRLENRERQSRALSAVASTLENRLRVSERSKGLWAQPAYREKVLAARAAANTPEVLAKNALANKTRLRTPEELAVRSAQMRRRWADPEEREKLTAKLRRPKTADERAKNSAARKRSWVTRRRNASVHKTEDA